MAGVRVYSSLEGPEVCHDLFSAAMLFHPCLASCNVMGLSAPDVSEHLPVLRVAIRRVWVLVSLFAVQQIQVQSRCKSSLVAWAAAVVSESVVAM